MVPAVVLLVSLYFCPHSPRWLATRDRWREALLTLAALHEGTYGRTSEGMTIHDPRVRAQYREIEDALRFEREQADGSFAALIKGRMVRRVVLGMSIQAWSQLCGMNIMMCWSNPWIPSSRCAFARTRYANDGRRRPRDRLHSVRDGGR